MGLFGKIKTALAFKRLADEVEKENKMGHDWSKTLKAVAVDFAVTSAAILTAYFADPVNLAAVLGVVPEHLRLALIPILSGAFVALRKRIKHGGPIGPAAPVLLLVLLPAFSSAQDPAPAPESADFLTYVKAHASIVSGVEIAGEKAEFVSLALDDDFALGGVRGFASLSLFSRQRAANPELPTSLEALSLYSAGEVQGGVYRVLSSRLAIECRAGMTFAMTGLTGTVGDPVDGSKFLGGCGPRISGPAGRLSILLGHHGPVTEGAKWFGFVPSTMFAGEFVLPANMALVVDIAAGRNLQTDSAVTSSRFAVRKRF